MFVPPVPPSEIEAAQQLLKQARKAFENGKLDEARALARRARYKIISWEDDNPYILLDEIEKAEATPSLTNSPVARPSAPSPKP